MLKYNQLTKKSNACIVSFSWMPTTRTFYLFILRSDVYLYQFAKYGAYPRLKLPTLVNLENLSNINKTYRRRTYRHAGRYIIPPRGKKHLKKVLKLLCMQHE